MKDYKAYFIIPAPPEQVYLALTTAETIRLWTGDEVVMVAQPGTEFSLWDGAIVGKNLSFEPGRKIEQQWYFGEQEEPSIVTIKLHEHKHGTSMEVRQSNIPDEEYDNIVDGWRTEYAASLIDFYAD
ncbi:SRPBCC domain-containing protein [Parapedobacter sp. ISTM3]|uniref:Activator of Hsp90 ATPase homolog 1-like protein n=1 Tax=Parapedobacter luteus TaxID=623280 RepID=A0A1T5E2A3_9SPHI|nr:MULTISPECIES: SRPBCC domain-containing protein [Parapedobacter]MBK1441029.1 SRPBCC domain-containing protein [Parapedobacter sp. ISTM3]SKB78024.1 Activator of Hsp90 ATPase homolog 1-like protein [Parapedobacter luteus]